MTPSPRPDGFLEQHARAASVVLTLGAIIILCGAGEIAMRIFGGVGYGGWGDPASIHLVKKQYYANSRGLRDREFDYQRAPGEFRLLCLGDSFTWGQMVPASAAYPKALERLLGDRDATRRYSVINAGQLGWSTVDEATWLSDEGVLYRPNVVVVGFFLNDAELGHYEIARLLPARLEAILSRSYFYFFVKYRVHMLKVRFGLESGYDEYLLELYAPGSEGWARCEAALGRIADESRAIGARPLVAIFPVIQDWARYPFLHAHKLVAEACAQRGIACIDLFDAFAASGLDWRELRVGPNDDHPSTAGHRIIAQGILEALEREQMLP
ncbi:MAG: SGNH/GDSL hydrolase family protein [bacterium]